MKTLKKYIAVITYCIGVDVVGLPAFWQNYIYDSYVIEIKSKFIK
jgi:hypothetical protein